MRRPAVANRVRLILALAAFTASAGTVAVATAAAATEVVHEQPPSGPLQGCTLSHPAGARAPLTLTGHCLGHDFANPPADAGEQSLRFCQVDDADPPHQVFGCLVDGHLESVFLLTTRRELPHGARPVVGIRPPVSSCIGQANPTLITRDIELGRGRPVTAVDRVRVRLTRWAYDPAAGDSKGVPNGLIQQDYDFARLPPSRSPGTMQQFITDAILGVGSEPMLLGGKRELVIACNRTVLDIELYEIERRPASPPTGFAPADAPADSPQLVLVSTSSTTGAQSTVAGGDVESVPLPPPPPEVLEARRKALEARQHPPGEPPPVAPHPPGSDPPSVTEPAEPTASSAGSYAHAAAGAASPPAGIALARRSYDCREFTAALSQYRPLAEHGDPEAQARVAVMYQLGRGVPPDGNAARQWAHEALALQTDVTDADPGLLTALADVHALGIDVTADPSKALALYRRAAQRGFPAAQFELGQRYASGIDVPRDAAQAAAWYREAAGHGHLLAQAALGEQSEAEGTAAGYSEAARWFRRAADAGSGEAQWHLAALYDQGHGVSADAAEAAYWYRKAASSLGTSAAKGNVVAEWLLGLMYRRGNGATMDDALSLTWLTKAARHNERHAQALLGEYYESSDDSRALHWYDAAAANGDTNARDHAYWLRYRGAGITAKVLAERRAAAAAGDANAEGSLGMMAVSGAGVKKDPARGLALLQKACEGNDGWACYGAALVYIGGTSPAGQDKALGSKYMQIAVGIGNPLAQELFAKIPEYFVQGSIGAARASGGDECGARCNQQCSYNNSQALATGTFSSCTPMCMGLCEAANGLRR